MLGLLFVRNMKRALAFTLALLIPTIFCAQRISGQSIIVLEHATVVDVRTGSLQSDMNVTVKGDRIVAVTRSVTSKTPTKAEIVDARGKYLIPGLWNMHVHLGDESFDKDYSLLLYLVNCVTTIRMMDGDPGYYTWRKDIESGSLVGPRMYIASPVIGN